MSKASVRNFFAVVEIRTKLVSVSTLLLATLYTVWRKGFPDPVLFVLMWAATLAVDMGTTAFNNYFDYLRGTDSWRDVSEADKVLVHSGVEPGFALWSALGCFTVALVFGLILAFSGHLWVIPAGAACMAVGFLYTGGPFPISRTPFGELFAGGCLGFALFSIACGVWSIPFDTGVLFAALPSVFWIAAILTVNNTCDIEGDRAAGRKTFSILVGPKGGEAAVIVLGLLGQTVGIAAAMAGFLPRVAVITLAVLSFPTAWVLYAMHKDGYSHRTKGPNMQRILSCFILFTISMGFALILNIILKVFRF